MKKEDIKYSHDNFPLLEIKANWWRRYFLIFFLILFISLAILEGLLTLMVNISSGNLAGIREFFFFFFFLVYIPIMIYSARFFPKHTFIFTKKGIIITESNSLSMEFDKTRNEIAKEFGGFREAAEFVFDESIEGAEKWGDVDVLLSKLQKNSVNLQYKRIKKVLIGRTLLDLVVRTKTVFIQTDRLISLTFIDGKNIPKIKEVLQTQGILVEEKTSTFVQHL